MRASRITWALALLAIGGACGDDTEPASTSNGGATGTVSTSSSVVSTTVTTATGSTSSDSTTSSTASTTSSTASATSSSSNGGGNGGADGGGGAGGTGGAGGGPSTGEIVHGRLLHKVMVEAVAMNSANDAFAAGRLTSSDPTDFGGGHIVTGDVFGSMFVVKYDAANNAVFAKQYGDIETQELDGVAADSVGGAFIGGWGRGVIDFGGGPHAANPTFSLEDALIGRLDANGNELWSHRYSFEADSSIDALATDSDDAVYFVGSASGDSVDFGGGPLLEQGGDDVWDVVVGKFDSDGNHVWSVRAIGFDPQAGYSIAVDAAGDSYVAGLFEGTISFGTGPTLTAASPDGDLFLVKLDPDGNHLWSQSFSSGDLMYGPVVACDAAGNVVVGGAQYGATDFGGGPVGGPGLPHGYLAEFDADGNYLFSQGYGSSYSGIGGVAFDSAGDIRVSGGFSGTLDLGGITFTAPMNIRDGFVARLHPDGSHVWSHQYGGSGDDRGGLLALSPSDAGVFSGAFQQTIMLGPDTLSTTLNSEYFLGRLAP